MKIRNCQSLVYGGILMAVGAIYLVTQKAQRNMGPLIEGAQAVILGIVCMVIGALFLVNAFRR